MNELEIAKDIIQTYLSKDMNIESIRDLYEIKSGNKKLLRGHIFALKNIFEKASIELDNILGDEK